MTLHEVNEAATLIQEAAHEDANIIFGSVIDANMDDEIRITVIATGFDRVAKMVEQPDHASNTRKIGSQLMMGNHHRAAPAAPPPPTIGQIAHSVKLAAQQTAIVTGLEKASSSAAPMLAAPQLVPEMTGAPTQPMPAREAAQGSGPNVVDEEWGDIQIDSGPIAAVADRAERALGRQASVAPVDRDPTARVLGPNDRVAQPIDATPERTRRRPPTAAIPRPG